MADTTARAGGITVRVSGLRQTLDAVTAAARASLEPALHTEISEVVRHARDRWPVRTGRSQRGLEVARAGTDTRARVVARNRVSYAQDVRIAGHTEPAWVELVERPVTTAAGELERAAVRVLEHEIQRRVDRSG